MKAMNTSPISVSLNIDIFQFSGKIMNYLVSSTKFTRNYVNVLQKSLNVITSISVLYNEHHFHVELNIQQNDNTRAVSFEIRYYQVFICICFFANLAPFESYSRA